TRLRIPFAADANGFPPNSEGDRLVAMIAAFEDAVHDSGGSHNATYVGRVTGGGVRVYYYYGRRQFDKACFVALEKRCPGSEFSAGDREDEKWTTYFSEIH